VKLKNLSERKILVKYVNVVSINTVERVLLGINGNTLKIITERRKPMEDKEYHYNDGYDHDYRYDHDHDYRYDRDYRYDYKMDGRRRSGRRYRTEEDDYMEELSECMKNGVCSAKDYEKLAEMTDNKEERSKLMKMAQREKEHYTAMKEMLEKRM
jgi:hypothetical protein